MGKVKLNLTCQQCKDALAQLLDLYSDAEVTISFSPDNLNEEYSHIHVEWTDI